MPSPISTPCSTRYKAVHDSGARRPGQIRNICIHSTEGANAEGAASWFANPKSEGSAQLVIDAEHCFRTLPDLMVPWAAPGLNTQGIHIELAGYARWTKSEWMTHPKELDRAAYKTAVRCNQYKIPVRWVGPIKLRLRWRGLTTHADVTKAWPLLARKYGSHTDPGEGFPKDRFLLLVKQHLAEIQV